MPRAVLPNNFCPSLRAVPLDPNELDHASQCWSTQIHLSSLPFSGYFKPDFVLEPVVSVCQSQLIESFVTEGSEEPVCLTQTLSCCPPFAAIISIWFGHKIVTVLYLSSSQWSRILEDVRTGCTFPYSTGFSSSFLVGNEAFVLQD